MSTFYYEQMKSVEFALRYAAGALLRARDAMPEFVKLSTTTKHELQASAEAIKVLEKNIVTWKAKINAKSSNITA